MTIPFAIGYILYAIQIIFLLTFTGRYGIFIPVFHFIATLFFIFVMMYSTYRVSFKRSVIWKGREIKVGNKRK
jgi:hypothetical protein